MTARGATRAALLAYLGTDPEPRPFLRIARYMLRKHGVSALATREQLRRLVAAGVVAKTDAGYAERNDGTKDAH